MDDQPVIILYGKTLLMESQFQNSSRLSCIRYKKTDMSAALLFQLRKTFLLQKHTMINNSDIICKKRNLRKNMAGNQNCFSSFSAKSLNKGTYLRNSNRVQSIDRFIQDQKLRIMHYCKSNGQSLLHSKGIL